MRKIVFGIDPDAERFGVAVYIDGKIDRLYQATAPEIIRDVCHLRKDSEILFSIENVMANQTVYERNRHENKEAQSKIAMRIGRNQQSQVELQRWLDFYEIPYVLHRPQKGNWKDKRGLFERLTGWKKSSNQDTRAAAFFGYLALSGN